MRDQTIYSVVDLEATGPDAAGGDRIIQFSCTFVQHQHIIGNFSTYVNPGIPIPERITQLTGITDEQVKNAPRFADIGDELYRMLLNTVFVAHNVNFDFPFFNLELTLIHHPTLKIKAIDTVTMSQILLPMLPSYQLRKISAYFNIVHTHPHSASSDASATAKLLILLVNRLHQLPFRTLKQILLVLPKLPRNTLEMFQITYRRKHRHFRPLPNYLRVSHGLVVRRFRPWHRVLGSRHVHYPLTKRAKQRIFHHQLAGRPVASKMMNVIYQSFCRNRHPRKLLLEIPQGGSRQLSYGLPLAYLSRHTHRTVVISTGNRWARQRLVNRTFPILNSLLPFPVTAEEAHDASDYLDLNRFANSLKVASSSHLSLLKAQILVWLTITETGNLDELHLSPRIPYLKALRCGSGSARSWSPFRRFNFVNLQRKRCRRSNFIIVSHRYLLRHAKRLGRSDPYLVIDDGMQLPPAALAQDRFRIKFNAVNVMCRRILSDVCRSHGLNLRMVLPNQNRIRAALSRLIRSVNQVQRIYKQISHRFSITFLAPSYLKPMTERLSCNYATGSQLDGFFRTETRNFRLFDRDVKLIQRITRQFQRLSWKRRYHDLNCLVMDRYYQHVARLIRQFKQFVSVADLVRRFPRNCQFVVITNQPHNVTQCELRGGILVLTGQLKSRIYRYFNSIVITDHALPVSHRYLKATLELTLNRTRLHREPIKLNSRSRILVYRNSALFKPAGRPQLVAWLGKKLCQIKLARRGRLLVAFSSQDLKVAVYNYLCDELTVPEPVYAQDLNGTPHQIMKQLVNAQDAIVMADYSWFDQLNLAHPNGFTTLALADLPLAVPQTGLARARFIKLKARLGDPLRRALLPKTILGLKQTLDRLVGSQVLAILDGRILKFMASSRILARFSDHVKIIH